MSGQHRRGGFSFGWYVAGVLLAAAVLYLVGR